MKWIALTLSLVAAERAWACCPTPGDCCTAPPTCASGVLTVPVSGMCGCTGSMMVSCAPYNYCADANTCGSSCSGDGQCVAGAYCSSGQCVFKLAKGASCTGDSVCVSGYCTDGVCCDGRCGAQCQACNLAGQPGHCANVVGTPIVGTGAGRQPCDGSGTSCGGACDGSSTSCAYPTTPCRPASCMNAVESMAANCDGKGSCAAATVASCGAYACSGTVCGTSCAGDGDCSGGAHCMTGACGAGQALGQSCGTNAMCLTGHCADGVCCDAVCDGPCRSCKGSGGHCMPFTSGDPRGQCGGGGKCGGACGADLACHYPAVDTPCDVCKACDGAGHCNQLPSSGDDAACGVIACGGLSTECVAFSDVTTRRCAALGLCVPAGDPSTCTQIIAQPDDTPCSGGRCRAGQCAAIADGGTAPPGKSGCAMARSSPRDLLALAVLLAWLSSRKRNVRAVARLLH